MTSVGALLDDLEAQGKRSSLTTPSKPRPGFVAGLDEIFRDCLASVIRE